MTPVTRNQLLAGATALAAGVALAACGVQTEEAGRSATVSTTPTVPSTSPQVSRQQREQAAIQRRYRALPQPRAGQVTVAGPADDVIGRQVIGGFNAQSSTNVTFARSQDRRAFADLCSGRVDIVETSSIATDAIRDACKANGLEVVEGLQLGSEAIVLATKNEADVGGDCITVQQARDIYRSGSPYTNWSQLGFDDLPLRTTGREPGSDNFEFFASIVLGRPGATLGDVRSDYRAYSQDARERREVTNADRITAAQRRVRLYRIRLRTTTRAERRRRVVAADRAADRRIIAAINRENRRRQRERIEVQDPEALERRNLRRVNEAKAAARLRANQAFDRELDRRAAEFERRVLRGAASTGVVGAFRFSYYELFEEQLRPLEIDFGVPETRSGQPVRLSDLTEADQRRIRGELQQQQQTATTATTPQSTTTSTTPQAQSQATGAQALDQLTLAGIDDLPERTADGEVIYRGPGCIFPAQITITSGAYPLTRRTFLVTTKRAIARREVQQFLRYTFDNVQREAPEQRLVPITDQQRRDAYIAFSGQPPADQQQPTTGTLTTSTSTTTTPGSTTTVPGSTTTTPGSTTTPGTTTTTPATTTPGSTTSTAPAAPAQDIPGVSSRGSGGG